MRLQELESSFRRSLASHVTNINSITTYGPCEPSDQRKDYALSTALYDSKMKKKMNLMGEVNEKDKTENVYTACFLIEVWTCMELTLLITVFSFGYRH